ncbi:hypothetical protein BS78_06G174900 [Paspalum vaginatum]|nr:hypothetical protein BS78_06G174900 [Paspalum vaginatum]
MDESQIPLPGFRFPPYLYILSAAAIFPFPPPLVPRRRCRRRRRRKRAKEESPRGGDHEGQVEEEAHEEAEEEAPKDEAEIQVGWWRSMVVMACLSNISLGVKAHGEMSAARGVIVHRLLNGLSGRSAYQ